MKNKMLNIARMSYEIEREFSSTVLPLFASYAHYQNDPFRRSNINIEGGLESVWLEDLYNDYIFHLCFVIK